jgi:hypothetical protein
MHCVVVSLWLDIIRKILWSLEMSRSPEGALNKLAKGRVHACWGHIYEALATLRPRKYFAKQPVNKGAWRQTIDLRGRKVVMAL